MMNASVFANSDYRDYLNSVFVRRQRGEKSKAAKQLKIHSTYLSQVLNGACHLSLEQADLLNRYLRHSPDESSYFIDMVQYGRAGTPSLKKFYQRRLHSQLKQHLERNPLEPSVAHPLSETQKMEFYSHWYIAAIHLLIANPKFWSTSKLMAYLSLSREQVTSAIKLLEKFGMLKKSGDSYEVVHKQTFLGKDSPLINKHHLNWRLKALASLDQKTSEDFHYSSVMTVGASEAEQIRKVFTTAVEEIREIAKNSKSEDQLYSYTMDFFKLGHEEQDQITEG